MARSHPDVFKRFSSLKSPEMVDLGVLDDAPTSNLGKHLLQELDEGRNDNALQRLGVALRTTHDGEVEVRRPWDEFPHEREMWVRATNELPVLKGNLEGMGVRLSNDFDKMWQRGSGQHEAGGTWLRTGRTIDVVNVLTGKPIGRNRDPRKGVQLMLDHISFTPFRQRLAVQLPCDGEDPITWQYKRCVFTAPNGLEHFYPPTDTLYANTPEFRGLNGEDVIIAGVVDEDNALKVVGVKAGVSTPGFRPELNGNVVTLRRAYEEHSLDFSKATLSDLLEVISKH